MQSLGGGGRTSTGSLVGGSPPTFASSFDKSMTGIASRGALGSFDKSMTGIARANGAAYMMRNITQQATESLESRPVNPPIVMILDRFCCLHSFSFVRTLFYARARLRAAEARCQLWARPCAHRGDTQHTCIADSQCSVLICFVLRVWEVCRIRKHTVGAHYFEIRTVK